MRLKRMYRKIERPQELFLSLGHRGFLNWLSDETYLKVAYRIKMDKTLNLENPTTFNEKIQWLKLNDRKTYYTKLVDKYEVGKYVANKIGKEHLIPLLGVYNDIDKINFDQLPSQFVLKCTHNSGGLIICKDKSKLNTKKVKRKLSKSLITNYYWGQREWVYKDVRPRIIAEKYMKDVETQELRDYKFFCFNGKPKIIQVMSERTESEFLINHFDLNWSELTIERKSIEINKDTPKRPENLEQMIEISKVLSEGIPFVRVDLYEVNGKVYFGEMTFFPVSGFMNFENQADDELLGSWIHLPKNN